jgi:hypothetical protein
MGNQRASNISTALLVTIVVVWAVTFAAIGLSADGVTGLCLEGRSPEPVTGYTWAQDSGNNCAWTMYSGTFPIRNRAADSVYLANGLTPPDTSPMLQSWQIVMILLAAGSTATLGLVRERLRAPSEEGAAMVAVPADAA